LRYSRKGGRRHCSICDSVGHNARTCSKK
jgi:hypothetical protein